MNSRVVRIISVIATLLVWIGCVVGMVYGFTLGTKQGLAMSLATFLPLTIMFGLFLYNDYKYFFVNKE